MSPLTAPEVQTAARYVRALGAGFAIGDFPDTFGAGMADLVLSIREHQQDVTTEEWRKAVAK